jgi:hypothetical protein
MRQRVKAVPVLGQGPPFERLLLGGRTLQMNMQSGQTGRGGLLDSFWAQMTLLAIVVIVLIALSAKYIW